MLLAQVFRRLIDDQLIARLPCVLVTASGFPDLATRTLVHHVVSTLGVRCFCLTDYNPHGMALMLAYKHGTSNYALERNASCTSLQWLGLRSAHVIPASTHGRTVGARDHGSIGARAAHAGHRALPEDSYQPFTQRDHSVLTGLARRQYVVASTAMRREVQHMAELAHKVEIEALYCVLRPPFMPTRPLTAAAVKRLLLGDVATARRTKGPLRCPANPVGHGFEYLSQFIHDQILHFDVDNWCDDGDEGDSAEALDTRQRFGDEHYSDMEEAQSYGRHSRDTEDEQQPSLTREEDEDWLLEPAPDW